jgi:hypothetical protein
MPSLIRLFYSHDNFQGKAMSISESVNNLTAVMGTLPTAFNTAVKKKRPATKAADSTNALNNDPLLITQTKINGPLNAHINDNAAHQVTAAQLGTYTKEETLALLEHMPGLESNPISQFGDLSYLSPGVTAFFEGATTNGAALDVAMNIEDDGGLTYLRNGTNGSTVGVFYAYVPNILNSITAPNKTNRRYRPPYFPTGSQAQYVVRSGEGIVAGRLMDETGLAGDYFISLTSGTFDDSNHKGCFIDRTEWPIGPNKMGEVILGNDGAYIITNVRRTDGSELFGFEVYFIPMWMLVSNAHVSLTLLTGWVTQSFYGSRTHASAIVLADRTKSLNAGDNPMVLANERYNNVWAFHEAEPSTYSTQRADGIIRTRISNGIYAANYESGAEEIRAFCASFTFNPYSRTAAVDTPGAGPVTVTYRPNGTVAIEGSLVLDDIKKIVPVGGWGFRVSARYHPTGRWFSINMYGVVDLATHLGRASTINGAMSLFDALHQSQHISGYHELGVYPQFGSAVGGTLSGCTLLPNNKFLLYCSGRTKQGTSSNNLVLCERGAYGFTYKSQYNGSYVGWAPSVKRDFVSDLGKNPLDYIALVSEVAANSTVKTSGSYFTQRIKLSSFLNLDSGLNSSGSVSIAPGLLVSLTAAIRSTAGLPAASPGYSSLSVIVPQNPAVPPFGVLTYTDPNMLESYLFAELQITAGSRTGDISGMSVVSASPEKKFLRVSFIQDDTSIAIISGGVTIYEGTDCYMVGGSTKTYARRTGSAGMCCFRFVIPKSSNRPDWSKLFIHESNGNSSTNYYTAVPGVGFGYNCQYNNESDGYTKLLFRTTARNLAEYTAWQDIDTRVQISQDVAQGWFVYFTQEIPFLLNGGYSKMPPQTLDLSEQYPDPSFQTFYVYLAGDPVSGYSYSITNMDNGEAAGRMFIGTVTTGATSITSIDVNKVTRLGMFRISTTNKGKSIPASPGNPSDNTGLLWTQ